MNWKTLLLKFLRNFVIGIVVSVSILSLIGYILGGWEGFINMVYFGVVLGVLGGLFAGIGVIVQANFWGKKGNYKFLPEWNWFINNSVDEYKKHND